MSRHLLAMLIVVLATATAAQERLPRVLVLESALPGTDEQDLSQPVAVAAASSDEFGVVDADRPRLLVFRSFAASWRLEKTVDLPAAPAGLAHDGRRYVVSLRNEPSLIAFEGEGLLQRRIALPRDTIPGPIAALSDGGLLLYDYGEERVLRLTPRGDLAGIVPIEGRVTAIAATPAGGFCVTVPERASVLRYRANDTLEAVWPVPEDFPVPAWPAGIAVEPGGDVVVTDRHANRVLILDASGTPIGVGSRSGEEPGLLRFPGAVARLPDGRIAVVDQGNGRVQLFRRSDRDGGP